MHLPGVMFEIIRRAIVDGLHTPEEARVRVFKALSEGAITQDEARKLLDMPMPNAPGGAC